MSAPCLPGASTVSHLYARWEPLVFDRYVARQRLAGRRERGLHACVDAADHHLADEIVDSFAGAFVRDHASLLKYAPYHRPREGKLMGHSPLYVHYRPAGLIFRHR